MISMISIDFQWDESQLREVKELEGAGGGWSLEDNEKNKGNPSA